MEKVVIVMPAYNEEARIGKTLNEYFSYFNQLKKEKKLDFEILVVLNACKDNTRQVVDKFKKNPLRVLDFERGGKGFAITEGFKDVLKRKGNLIGFTDADGSTPPNAFYGLIRHLKNADGIIANRWDKRSKIYPKQSILRRFVSRGYNFIVRIFFFFPHKDTQCGAKLFRGNLLKKIIPKLGITEWGFDVDLLFYSRREGAKIKSIPTMWHDEKGSKINLKRTPIKMFLSAVRLRLYHSKLKFLIKIYGKLPEKWKIHKWK